TINSVKQIHAIVDGKAVVISESSVRSILLFDDEDGITCLTNDEIFENLALMGYEQLSTKLTFQKDHGADEAVHKEGGDSMEKAITTDTSLVVAQDSGSLRHQETIGGALAQTRSERVLEKPNELPLPEGGYTPGSDKGRLKLKELMAICTKLSKQVLDLENEKMHKLQVESSDDDLDKEDASKQGRESDKTKLMFQESNFDVLDDDMEDVEGETDHTATTRVSAVSAPVTTAGTLIKMKEEKAKEKGVAIKDVEVYPRPIISITTLQPLLTIDPKDKELAQRLHEEELAELDIAEKERQKQEEATSDVLAEEFNEIQDRIDTDHELAVRLTHEEKEKYTIEERARLLAEFI
ncbi:hypothetical protein Tco_1450642, partial [Tanacetum coccineum]